MTDVQVNSNSNTASKLQRNNDVRRRTGWCLLCARFPVQPYFCEQARMPEARRSPLVEHQFRHLGEYTLSENHTVFSKLFNTFLISHALYLLLLLHAKNSRGREETHENNLPFERLFIFGGIFVFWRRVCVYRLCQGI